MGQSRGKVYYILDRKSTRLNSSHSQISYAVFCLKKKSSVVQDHCGTFSGQRERRASPHPLARTPGHERDVAFQGPWHAAGNGVRSITLSGNVVTKATRAMSGSASADQSPSRMDLPARSVGLAGRADFGG